MASKKTAPLTPQERAQKFAAEEKKLLGKYGLQRKLLIVFPDTDRVPLRGRIAARLIKSAGGKVESVFVEQS